MAVVAARRAFVFIHPNLIIHDIIYI